MTCPSEAGGESSSASSSGRKRKSASGTVFKSWSFQLMSRADLRHGTTAVEKAKLLKEYLSARTGNTRPLCVIGVIVFCDESLTGTSHDTDLKNKAKHGWGNSDESNAGEFKIQRKSGGSTVKRAKAHTCVAKCVVL
jgi:hypothetical protein